MKKMFLVTIPSENKPPKRFITDSTERISDIHSVYMVETLDFIPVPVEPIDIFKGVPN